MRVTVNSQQLAAELRLVTKIVPTKPAIHILSHVLLKADVDLQLYTTDLEVAIATSCAAQVAVPGVVTLPAARLLALVEQFPDADVDFTYDNDADRHVVIVKCGAFTSKLQALPATDFPAPPTIEGTSCQLDAEALRHLINSTRYAVIASATKYILQGALLTLSGDTAAMATTDSKRLALIKTTRTGTDMQMVIPAKTLDTLGAQAGVGDVTVTVGPQHLFFLLGRVLIISRTIAGKFPAYERIIPHSNDHHVVADKQALAAALRRVNLTSEETEAVYFDVTPGVLNLSSASAGIGSASEPVAVEYDGPQLRVCINGTYVLDFLNVAVEPVVTLRFKDATSAVLVTDGNDHLAVIMAMRT